MDTIYRNADQTATGVVRNPDGTPYDLSSKSLEFFVKKPGSGEILTYKSSANANTGLSILSPATDGKYQVLFAALETMNYPAGVFKFGFIVRNDSGQIVYAGGGELQVKAMGD